MRMRLFLLLLLAGAAVPATAQTDRRVERLEQEVRALQRQVFPNGRPSVQPEITPAQPGGTAPGVPATSALSDVTARLDALERQLATLTGQIEEMSFRVRQLEQNYTAMREQAEARAVEAAPAPVTTAGTETGETESAAPPATDAAPISAPATGDPAEDAYLTGYRLWEAKRFADADTVLQKMARDFPRHRRASWARNLAGRALLDDGKPAAAAKVLLENYQTNPKGERAPDSLFYLGQSLAALKRPTEACQAWAELADVYPDMRAQLARDLPAARQAAGCK
jgi:TolA-binding protein